jgi:hypothetical protein
VWQVEALQGGVRDAEKIVFFKLLFSLEVGVDEWGGGGYTVQLLIYHI